MTQSPNVDNAAVLTLAADPEIAEALLKIGDEIAVDAKILAPKRTGAGAESIHAELGRDEAGDYVRVSWASERFYMKFHELGSSHQKPTPFLRPAAAKHRGNV